MLDWSLQNLPLIKSRDQIDLFVTYEQMVLEPDVIVDCLVNVLDLNSTGRIKKRVWEASGSVSQANRKAIESVHSYSSDRTPLIAKWRNKINSADECKLMRIVSELGIDMYEAGSLTPSQKYWLVASHPDATAVR